MDVGCAAFLLCAVALIAPWTGAAGSLEYVLGAWWLVLVGSRCLLARVGGALGCRLLGDAEAVKVGRCAVGLLGGFVLSDLRLRLPAGPHAHWRLEISSVALSAPLSAVCGKKHNGVKLKVGYVQATLCLRDGWSAAPPPLSSADGTAAQAPAVPAEEACSAPAAAAAGTGLSRVKRLLLRLIEVEIDTVGVVISGCRTAESATERLSFVLPGVRINTERVEEGERGAVNLCVQSRHTISLFGDSGGELPHRALKMGSCSARARLSRSGSLLSRKVEIAEPVELCANAAVLTTALQLVDFAKSQRPSKVKSKPAAAEAEAEATAPPLEVTVGSIAASASLGGQTVSVTAIGLTVRPDAASDLKLLSVAMNGHKVVDLSDRITYERDAATNTLSVRVARTRMDFPHELHFGNTLADVLIEYKAIKCALALARPPPPVAPERWKRTPAATFVFECDEGFQLRFADDPLDGWLNSRYPHLRVEHEEVVVDCHAFDKKCEEELGIGKADPEMVAQANHIIRQKGAARYRERLHSIPTREVHPVLAVTIGAVEMKLEQDDWACSLDGVLARLEEYGGELPAEGKETFAWTELIGRTISLDFRDTTAQIRDFSFPLLKAGVLQISGPLVIAEQSVSSMFCLSKGFGVGETTAPVVKALAPMKVYHSLRCDATQLELNYGVALLPALADACSAAARLSADSLDPGKPLPWWDKLRYKAHGKLSGTFNNFRLRILADHSPHVFDENMVLDITQLDLDMNGNLWKLEGHDINMKLVVGAAELGDTMYFPVLNLAAQMHWLSKVQSHYVQAFATSAEEAFPNRAPVRTEHAPPTEWSGPILAPDAPMVLGATWSWGCQVLKALPVPRQRQRLASGNRRYRGWVVSPPRTRAAVMKLPRTKLGMARKQKTTSLGELLQTLDLNLNLGQATLRFWNLEDVCLEIGLAAGAVRQHTVVDDASATPPTKMTGMHLVAENLVARFLAGEGQATRLPGPGHWSQLGSCGNLTLCHNTRRVPVPAPVLERDPGGPTPLPPVTPDSEVLLANLFANPSSVPPPEQITKQGSHLAGGTDGIAVTVSDMLMWCSLDSRNTLYDFILSFDSVVESAVAKTPRTRAEERATAESEAAGRMKAATMQPDEDLLSFLSRTRSASKSTLPVPDSTGGGGEGIGHPHTTSLSVRFVRPQIRLESEDFGSVFLTAMGATIENSTHGESQLTQMSDDVGRTAVSGSDERPADAGRAASLLHDQEVRKVLQVSLDQAQMFAAPAGSMKADERIPWTDAMASQKPVTTSHVVLGRAQRILAPCPIHMAYTRWKRQEKQRPNSVTVHIDSVALALSARHFETLTDVFANVLLIRPPRKEWLEEEKERLFFEGQVGSSQQAVDRATVLHQSLLEIRQQLQGLPDDRQQARAALKVKERATAERMMEVAKEGSPRGRRSDALASLDLQLKVDVSSVKWYMMDRAWEPTAYFEMHGYEIKQEHFADLSTKSEISIEDFIMMDDDRNEVFARNQLPLLPGQAVDREDKLLSVHWKTEGRWKAGIKIFDRLEVVLQPVRISINQDLIEQLKIYSFPPPIDTSAAQQAFHFGDRIMELGVEPAVAGGGVALVPDRASAPAELERGVSAEGGTGHFGDRMSLGQETSRPRAGTSSASHFGDRMMTLSVATLEPPPLPSSLSTAGGGGGGGGSGDLSLVVEDDSSEQDEASSTQLEQQSGECETGATVAMERAQKAHAFGQIRLGALEIEASYKGKLLPDFERVPLTVKAISYQREVWTIQELLEHIGWDIKKAVAKSVANTTLSAAGNAVSKLGGQLAAPAGAAKRSLFDKKKASLLGGGR